MRLLSLLALGLLSLAVGCDKPAEVTQPPVQVLIGEGSADPAALAAMAQKQAPEASGAVGCGGEVERRGDLGAHGDAQMRHDFAGKGVRNLH